MLEGDAAIRWQTLRDLVGAAQPTLDRERMKIARSGWGLALLDRQETDGRWASAESADGGLYSPKWTSTTYTMLLLRDFGLQPNTKKARQACRVLLDAGLQFDGGINYGTSAKLSGQSETCITGMVLSILSYFEFDDDRLETIAEHLLDQQMSDGGWNCSRPRGATHSSVHTTISAVEGLRFYELHRGHKLRMLRDAQRRAREFLLVHRLFRSHRSGEIINPVFTRFAYPPRWHYDILRALDYFRSVDAPRDRRLSEAIDIVRKKRQPDGRWPLQNVYKGRTYFELEPSGAPSRWNTLRALRVLKWWDRKS